MSTFQPKQSELGIVNGVPLPEMPEDLFIPPQALEICLETFTGPMDLLLYLIKKQNIKQLYDEDKKLLLELGEIWWWESNRMIPINIFLRKEILPLNYAMMTMNTKDVKVSVGPCVNLNNLSLKRVKRKSVQVMRRSR